MGYLSHGFVNEMCHYSNLICVRGNACYNKCDSKSVLFMYKCR